MKNVKTLVEYNRNYDSRILDRIFTDLELKDDLANANYIVIKPNFSAGQHAKPNSHVVSDLQMIGEIASYILNSFPNKLIYIAESDSTAYGFAFLKFENLNLFESLKIDPAFIKNLRLLDLSRDRLIRTEDRRFKYFTDSSKQLWLSKTLMDSEFIIDATNLKTHTTTGFTGACKNLFGTLPKSEKWVFHTHISDIIHDLTLAVNPKICIVDGFYGMDINGPVTGRPIDVGFRVWSKSAVCADIVSCRMSGIDPKRIKHLSELAGSEAIDSDKLIADTDIDPNKVAVFNQPEKLPQLIEKIGLTIQSVGESIQRFGRKIVCKSTVLQRKDPRKKAD